MYHRNLITNTASINIKEIRVLFINLKIDAKLSLKMIFSKACLGMTK